MSELQTYAVCGSSWAELTETSSVFSYWLKGSESVSLKAWRQRSPSEARLPSHGWVVWGAEQPQGNEECFEVSFLFLDELKGRWRHPAPPSIILQLHKDTALVRAIPQLSHLLLPCLITARLFLHLIQRPSVSCRDKMNNGIDRVKGCFSLLPYGSAAWGGMGAEAAAVERGKF